MPGTVKGFANVTKYDPYLFSIIKIAFANVSYQSIDWNTAESLGAIPDRTGLMRLLATTCI